MSSGYWSGTDACDSTVASELDMPLSAIEPIKGDTTVALGR